MDQTTASLTSPPRADLAGHRPPRLLYLSDTAAGAGSGRFGWRLLAANNRALGRGLRAVTALTECQMLAHEVRDAVRSSHSEVVLDVCRGRWTWSITVDGIPCAVSVHSYMRRVECTRAVEQFRSALLAADPDIGTVRYFGPRSLRDYDPSSPAQAPGTTQN